MTDDNIEEALVSQERRIQFDEELVRAFTALLYQTTQQVRLPAAAEQTPEFRHAVEAYTTAAAGLATPVAGRQPCGAHQWNLPELNEAAARNVRHRYSY